MRERWGAAAGAWLLAVAFGPVLGTLWWLAAPTPQFVVGDGGAVSTATEPPADWFGADGWFLAVGAVTGVVVGLLTARRWRDHPVSALLGMTVGMLVAAALAWWLGGVLGADPLADQLRAAGVGDRLTEPLGLRATGVLVAPAFLAVAAFATVVAMRSPAVPTPAAKAPAAEVPAGEVPAEEPFSPDGTPGPSSPR